jgi:hypothetical protein
VSSLLPNAKQQFFGPNGVPLSGGNVYWYIPNTTTPKNTWQDQALTVLNPNPTPLDANGECIAWGTGSYRQQVYDANGNLIWDQVTTASTSDGSLGSTVVPYGASLIGFDGTTLDQQFLSRVNRVVDSISALRALSHSTYTRAAVTGYYAAGDGGGGTYWYDPTDTTSSDNGVTIIVAADGGRWKLQHFGTVSLKQCGSKEDGSTDDLPAWNRAMALSGIEITFAGISIVSNQVSLVNNNTKIRGVTPAATIKAQNAANFQYVLRAVGLSGCRFYDFTVDANQANRAAQLTTRTVPFDMNSCTDCQADRMTFTNALGYTGSISGIGGTISGTSSRCKITNSLAINCGTALLPSDGFYCSGSDSLLEGNTAVNCFDTGHVLESCNGSGIVGCRSVGCGAVGAITNAISTDTYGNYIDGLSGTDWNSSVTGGIQIGALSSGNLLDTVVRGVNIQGVNNNIGPAINVRKTSTGVVNGLDIDASIRNSNTQGILINGAQRVSIKANIIGTTAACIQIQGGSSDVFITGTRLTVSNGTFGVYVADTSVATVSGIRSRGGSYGIYADNTSSVVSLMNDIGSVSTAYEGAAGSATLQRMSLVAGKFSISGLAGSAPTGTQVNKFSAVDQAGNGVGVLPIYNG